jgi:hypothetical protein
VRAHSKTEIDFQALMEPVTRRLFGDPNPHLSNSTNLCFGNRGSLAINLYKGAWYDHELGRGGGVLDLIERETGKSKAEAMKWLAAERLRPRRYLADRTRGTARLEVARGRRRRRRRLVAVDLTKHAVWAAASAPHMPGLAGWVPAFVNSVIVLVDGDKAGRTNSQTRQSTAQARH